MFSATYSARSKVRGHLEIYYGRFIRETPNPSTNQAEDWELIEPPPTNRTESRNSVIFFNVANQCDVYFINLKFVGQSHRFVDSVATWMGREIGCKRTNLLCESSG